MSERNRLREFNYDIDEFIGHVVYLCFIMGISEVVIKSSMLEMDVLDEYCKNMVKTIDEYATKTPEGCLMIYYNGKKLTFKPE